MMCKCVCVCVSGSGTEGYKCSCLCDYHNTFLTSFLAFLGRFGLLGEAGVQPGGGLAVVTGAQRGDSRCRCSRDACWISDLTSRNVSTLSASL